MPSPAFCSDISIFSYFQQQLLSVVKFRINFTSINLKIWKYQACKNWPTSSRPDSRRGGKHRLRKYPSPCNPNHYAAALNRSNLMARRSRSGQSSARLGKSRDPP